MSNKIYHINFKSTVFNRDPKAPTNSQVAYTTIYPMNNWWQKLVRNRGNLLITVTASTVDDITYSFLFIYCTICLTEVISLHTKSMLCYRETETWEQRPIEECKLSPNNEISFYVNGRMTAKLPEYSFYHWRKSKFSKALSYSMCENSLVNWT